MEVLVGRQPICDRDHAVVAYELLYRGAAGSAPFDGDRASASVTLHTVIELGIENVVGSRLAFVNMTRRFLIEGLYQALPVRQSVLEVLEDIEPDEEVLEALEQAAGLGYRIALDDFVLEETNRPLLQFADVIKVDVLAISDEEVDRYATELAAPGRILLAEKVETYADFERCRDAGYEWFQGYFFCKPRVLSAQSVASDRLSLIELLAAVQDPDVAVDSVVERISRDVALSYKLLRYVNSALFSLSEPIESIHQAVVLLGMARIQSVVAVLLVTAADHSSPELVELALVRAQCCRLLAEHSSLALNEDKAFTVGLLSLVDALMSMPMERVLESVPLAEDVQEALTERSGQLGSVLDVAVACERGDWDRIDSSSLVTDVQAAYLGAIEWGARIGRELAD